MYSYIEDMLVYDMIVQERLHAADLFESLTGDQLATRSLCEAWTMHEVAAHMATYLRFGQLKILTCMTLGAGDFAPGNQWLAQRFARHSTPELVSMLRRHAASRTTIPRSGYDPVLTDLVLHDLDVRLPLGIDRALAEDRLAVAFHHLATVPAAGYAIGDRLRQLRFETTDTGWSSGRGAPVRGPALDVLLAMSGRAVALSSLEGDGVELLAARISQDAPIPLPQRLRKMFMTVLKPSECRARDEQAPVLD